MRLPELLDWLKIALPPTTISGIKLDSRQVANGDLFVAVSGYVTDGRDYIDAAIKAGAAAVLAEDTKLWVEQQQAVPIVHIPDLKAQLSRIAGNFFAHPSAQTRLLGITGTNGKTSVTHLIAQLVQAMGEPAGLIGTTGSGLVGALLPEKHTTPDAVTVQQRIATLVAEGAKVIAMEVSSHALVQGRVEALQFSSVAATNISRDHLDYHGSMTEYVKAKQRLFTDFKAPHQLINADDKALRHWLTGQPGTMITGLAAVQKDAKPVDAAASLLADNIQYRPDGTRFDVDYQSIAQSSQAETIQSPLLGQFNVYNLLTALGVLLAEGYPLQQLAHACHQLQPVPGRMEAFQNADSALIVVDYAHTPDALQQVLSALRKHCRGQLWCVFGCGGDRDRGKRPQMGKVAVEYADHVVVTDDNPRTEPAEQIIADILTGTLNNTKTRVIQGRYQAVVDTMARAGRNDVVLLAGKGHEDYQVIGTQRFDYDERATVAAWLQGDRA